MTYINLKGFDLSKLQIGDTMTYAIVKKVMSEYGARIFVSNFAQSCQIRTVYDPLLKKKRPIHYTFQLQSDGLWKYCGECFFIENEQRIPMPKQLVLEVQ